uniref:Uncharacterized protein n=1 Tax=Thermogemmatispora argillosa TaxID=2045280 RepID=A0A455SX41_9CHLR|nr:hypothetical protein KTA_03450 [Thermogemmatispora argillosa]
MRLYACSRRDGFPVGLILALLRTSCPFPGTGNPASTIPMPATILSREEQRPREWAPSHLAAQHTRAGSRAAGLQMDAAAAPAQPAPALARSEHPTREALAAE